MTYYKHNLDLLTNRQKSGLFIKNTTYSLIKKKYKKNLTHSENSNAIYALNKANGITESIYKIIGFQIKYKKEYKFGK